LQEEDFSEESEINVSDTEDSSETSMKRGPRRPKLIKTGSRGWPKKSYNMLANKNQEAGMFAKVSLREAISGPSMDEWYIAMATELQSILQNDVWKLVDRPSDKKLSEVVLF